MERYAEIVRMKMRTKDNPSGNPITLRELSRRMSYSYEHLRKVVKGEPVVSEQLNEQLCVELGLDPKKMWEIAVREKLQRRYADIPVSVVAPPDTFIKEAWKKLTDEDKAKLRRIIEGMVLTNEATPVKH